ncbi:MAG: YkgJ family cysteine cluster protein [Bryobacteraceae bacterium]
MAENSLRFTCQPGCTRCCRVKGYVYLSEADLVRAAAYLGLTTADFEAKYLIRYRRLLRLRRTPQKECHFLRENGCSIHPAKPTQCRLYPFWPELVENREAWKRERDVCPGIGKGELIQIGSACEIAHEMKEVYPTIYR